MPTRDWLTSYEETNVDWQNDNDLGVTPSSDSDSYEWLNKTLELCIRMLELWVKRLAPFPSFAGIGN